VNGHIKAHDEENARRGYQFLLMMGTGELRRARASGIFACVMKAKATAPEANPAALGRFT